MAALNLIAGGGFMLSTLLLARKLVERDFAEIVLLVSILAVATQIGPFGLAVLSIRKSLSPNLQLLLRSTIHAIVVAALTAFIAHFLYDIAEPLLIPLFLASFSGSLATVAAAQYTLDERFISAFFVGQGINYFLLLAAFGAAVGFIEKSISVLWILAGGQLLLVLLVWPLLFRATPERPRHSLPTPFPWRECFNLAGITAAVMLHAQFERLVIPVLLTLDDLALFVALAIFTLAPFRVVQQAIVRTFMARMRNHVTTVARRRLLFSELLLMLLVTTGISVVAWHVTRSWSNWLLSGKYSFPAPLVVAVLLMAQLRTLLSIFHGAVGALATPRQLAWWNMVGWMTVALAWIAAWAFSAWGLLGIVTSMIIVTILRIFCSLPILYDRLEGAHVLFVGRHREATIPSGPRNRKCASGQEDSKQSASKTYDEQRG